MISASSESCDVRNVTRFELFFGRDPSRTWNQMSHLGPFSDLVFWEIALVSSFSSSETGSKMVRTDTGDRTTETGRTDTHDFLEPPLHNKPFGQLFCVLLQRYYLHDSDGSVLRDYSDEDQWCTDYWETTMYCRWSELFFCHKLWILEYISSVYWRISPKIRLRGCAADRIPTFNIRNVS